MVDALIESGKRALEKKPQDFLDGAKGGTKVLHADEVRNWRVSAGGFPVNGRHSDAGHDGDAERPDDALDPISIAVPNSEDESEDEVEAMAFEQDNSPPALPPPITITPSLSP